MNMNKKFAVSESISGSQIRSFRKKNRISRTELASILNVSARTLEKWETDKQVISGPVVFLMQILSDREELLDYYRLPEKKYPLRMFYMCDNRISTVIDVDMLKQKVFFRNYTSNLLLRAFGNKESVAYQEYEDFLESRCFPRSRDKIKVELGALDLTSYDPLSIIRKTKGRMAEDDCYIEFEDEQWSI